MRYSLLMIVASMLVATSAGLAAAPGHHHMRQPRPVFAQPQSPGSFEPPRMIEIPPGQWVSTYDECGDPCDSN
jgi:acyl dehydratase